MTQESARAISRRRPSNTALDLGIGESTKAVQSRKRNTLYYFRIQVKLGIPYSRSEKKCAGNRVAPFPFCTKAVVAAVLRGKRGFDLADVGSLRVNLNRGAILLCVRGCSKGDGTDTQAMRKYFCFLHLARLNISGGHYVCRSKAAAKNPSVPWTCGHKRSRWPVSTAMRCARSRSAHDSCLNSGRPAAKASTTASFSSRRMLQVA